MPEIHETQELSNKEKNSKGLFGNQKRCWDFGWVSFLLYLDLPLSLLFAFHFVSFLGLYFWSLIAFSFVFFSIMFLDFCFVSFFGLWFCFPSHSHFSVLFFGFDFIFGFVFITLMILRALILFFSLVSLSLGFGFSFGDSYFHLFLYKKIKFNKETRISMNPLQKIENFTVIDQ